MSAAAHIQLSHIEHIFEDLDPESVTAIVRPEPFLRADAIAFVRFEKADLYRQAQFLEDFGIQIASQTATDLYGRGTGSAPFIYHARKGPKSRFVGVGFTVAKREELERAAQIPEASPIEAEPGPGGGSRVRVNDPNGFEVTFIHGQIPAEPIAETFISIPANNAHASARANTSVRPPLASASVMKLGHVVFQCMDFDTTLDWWMRYVGLIPSDAQILSDGSVNLAFCRLDRGDTPADHHTIALAGGVGPIYMHSAYEVGDMEAVGQGQQALKAGGWKHGWGIGRHYYGSQIFDYWRDPDGDLMEHYTDGDLFDASVPIRYSRFTRGSTWMWGADQPKDFEAITFGAMMIALRNLIAGRISLKRLKLVMQALKPASRPWLK